jgi:phage-related protein
MNPSDKPLIWIEGEVVSPPFSREDRIEAGYLLRLIQKGVNISSPHSRPMPSIGKACHELRINDRHKTWRIFYQIRQTEILILHVFDKKTQQTPKPVLDVCKRRIREFEDVTGGENE